MHARRTDVYELLYQFNIHADSSGFFYIAHAIYLCAQQPDRRLFPDKWLIPAIARHYQISPDAIRSAMQEALKTTSLSSLYNAFICEKIA
jgi:hypothetical protein